MSKKISELTELATLADDDEFAIVDESETDIDNKTKKVSWYTIKGSLSADAAGNIEIYDSSTTYEPSSEGVFVSHNGNIWQFISSTPQTNKEPGAPGSAGIWQSSSVGALTHQQNKDLWMALGSKYEIFVAQIAKPLYATTAETSNSGTSETTLANAQYARVGAFDFIGSTVSFKFSGVTASNTNSKAFKIKIGPSLESEIFNLSGLTTSAFNWRIEGEAILDATGVMLKTSVIFYSDTSNPVRIQYNSADTSAWAASNINLALLATGGASADITIKTGYVSIVKAIG